VDGVEYLLPYESWYTPSVSDVVSVDWTREVIVGELSTSPAHQDEPSTPTPKKTPFDVTIAASASGKYDLNWNNWWGGSEVWASNNNDGIWVYGNRVRDGVGSGATVSRIWINLPLISTVGNCYIGLHSHPSIPGGAPSLSSVITLGQRGGWVELPLSFGQFLQAGGRGIGVGANPGGGLTKWRGAPSPDAWSGALRIQGTR